MKKKKKKEITIIYFKNIFSRRKGKAFPIEI